MKRVYLSLNQGITFLKDELGEPAAINELKRRASFIRDRIKEYKDSFSFENIDLSANDNDGMDTLTYVINDLPSSGKIYDICANVEITTIPYSLIQKYDVAYYQVLQPKLFQNL